MEGFDEIMDDDDIPLALVSYFESTNTGLVRRSQRSPRLEPMFPIAPWSQRLKYHLFLVPHLPVPKYLVPNCPPSKLSGTQLSKIKLSDNIIFIFINNCNLINL